MSVTLASWQRLWGELGATVANGGLMNQLVAAYSERQRHYHTLQHLRECLVQFDAAAMPMFHSFQPQPDLRPYNALPVTVNLEEQNLKTAWGSGRSKKMDFSKEDAADDLQLNEVIWKSIRGKTLPMPAPVRAAFVFPHPHDDDDD